MLYEVTGMRLFRREFFGESSSSDSENDEAPEELQPIEYAFMERFDEEEDVEKN